MSRVIKFKVWDGERMSEGMLLVEMHYDSSVGAVIDTNWQPPIYLQFTGLLDREGKEVYEGDIVLYGYYEDDDGNDNLNTPMQFSVKWEQESCSWCANGRLVAKNGIYPFEIIGNIYEATD